jgi:hypothetical protein
MGSAAYMKISRYRNATLRVSSANTVLAAVVLPKAALPPNKRMTGAAKGRIKTHNTILKFLHCAESVVCFSKGQSLIKPNNGLSAYHDPKLFSGVALVCKYHSHMSQRNLKITK